MSFYKEICDIPFRDFNLKEFACWTEIFNLNKKQNFLNTTPEHSIQIVYYHISIENYNGAISFLDCCDPTNNQVIFLKLLFFFTNISDVRPRAFGLISSLPFSSYHRDLLKLGLDNYVPALKRIGNVNFINICIGLNVVPNIILVEDILADLIKIKQSCEQIQFDCYYIYHIDKRIEDLKCCISNPISPIGDTWITSPYLPLNDLFELISNGSEGAAMNMFYIMTSFCAKMNGNTVEPTTQLEIKAKKISNKFLYKKLQNMDINTIIDILKAFKQLSLERINNLHIESPLNLITKCLNVAYYYLERQNFNVGLITAYLEYFIEEEDIGLPKCYKSICKPILSSCYNVGLLIVPDILYLTRSNIYKKFPIESMENYARVIIVVPMDRNNFSQ